MLPAFLGPLSHTVSQSPRVLGIATLFDPSKPSLPPSPTAQEILGHAPRAKFSAALCLGATPRRVPNSVSV